MRGRISLCMCVCCMRCCSRLQCVGVFCARYAVPVLVSPSCLCTLTTLHAFGMLTSYLFGALWNAANAEVSKHEYDANRFDVRLDDQVRTSTSARCPCA